MDMDLFFSSYLETALWSSLDWTDADDSQPDPMDKRYGVDDFDGPTRDQLRSECEDFVRYVGEVCPDATAELDADPGRAGHDFWLTRNGHGAGFWDGDWVLGRELTDAAQTFGSCDLYASNGKVYAN